MPMADRAVLQMDKATFTDQSVLWNIGKRRKNTNLDSNLGLRVDCFGEKETEFGYNSLHFSTDFERQCI